MHIRPMTPSDGDRVVEIYGRAIKSGHATFQEDPGTWESWDQGHLPECRLVACDDNDMVIGWAGLSGVSNRCVYRGIAEISVYVDPDCQGQGVGKSLLAALIKSSEEHGIWSLEAGIFPENEASIALHQSLGFETVGRKRGLGRMGYGPMAGLWRDVMLLQRRSQVVGVN
ncbi:GNAT family N-acetyltransferase [Thalassospira sp.]|uniref:GNAT family N-acetyltransferase n=1 Tax=Thalassospira sp. TaxID=1912094 RepID=UPI000C4585F4|nr:GNAT family N-acetyltransferase [Thalassospira sp.]MBC06890.1 N-acetyltransferase [Thalassospira sp.]|tara:strand:- start:3763 stop:4272 length:510 start_codon:yes stop_codon:yes gene_type:complete